MPALRELFGVIAAQYSRVRTGLDVGFNDEGVTNTLRDTFGGLWLSIGVREAFPFDDTQFEVVVLDGRCLTPECVRETHRVLRPQGCAFFTVNAKTRKQEGHTLSSLYRLVGNGFDIITVKKPRWWYFGRHGRTMTVCLRRKTWHEAKPFVRSKGLTLETFGKRA